MLGPEWAVVAAVAGVVFAAALVSSIAGFAFSALAGAALLRLLEDPLRTVTVIVTCSIAIQAYSVWSLRRAIEWRKLWPFLAGGALTVPLGVWLLARLPPHLFALGLGTFLVVYGMYLLLRRNAPLLRPTLRSDVLAGALGGVAGGLAGFPGSFVTIWCAMRGWPKERQRGVYQPYILLMQLEALLCLRVASPGAVTAEMLALYVPVALAAAYVGLAFFRSMTDRQFNKAVYLLLIVSGVSLLAGMPHG